MWLAGHVIRMGKETAGKTKSRWVENIQMDHVVIGVGDMDSIGLAQDKDKWRAPVGFIMSLRIP
jgi:hypothetical protein